MRVFPERSEQSDAQLLLDLADKRVSWRFVRLHVTSRQVPHIRVPRTVTRTVTEQHGVGTQQHGRDDLVLIGMTARGHGLSLAHDYRRRGRRERRPPGDVLEAADRAFVRNQGGQRAIWVRPRGHPLPQPAGAVRDPP